MRDYGPSPPVNTKVAGTFLNTSNIGRESSIHLCHKYCCNFRVNPPDYNPLTLVPNESGVVHDGSNIRTYQVAFKVWTQPEIKTYGYWYNLHFSRRNTGLLYCTGRSTPVAQLAPRNLLTRWDVSSIPANGIFLTKN